MSLDRKIVVTRSRLVIGGILAGAISLAAWAWHLYSIREDRAVRQPYRISWVFEPPARGAIVSTPAIVDGRVYVSVIHDEGLATRGAVYCLDEETGQAIWSFDDGGKMQHMFSSPTIANGLLYVGEGMHQNFSCKLYCLDTATGKKHWDYLTTSHVESTPCVVDGRVYFGAGDDGVYCLDAVTGQRIWQHRGPIHVDTTPTAHEGWLYAGSGVSRAHKHPAALCLRLADGKVRWERPTDLPAWGSPVVDGERVFYGLGNGRMTESARPPETPSGGLLCLKAGSGEVLWQYPVADAVLARPAVERGFVYFGARDCWCYCVDARDARLGWKLRLDGPLVSSPVPVDGGLYVLTSTGSCYCVNLAGGDVRWKFDMAAYSKTQPRTFSSPAVIAVRDASGTRRRVFLTAELRNPVNSAAVVYCLQEQ